MPNIQNEIKSLINEIELIFSSLEASTHFPNTIKKYEDQYASIKQKYESPSILLSLSNSGYYAFELEADVLVGLRNLKELSDLLLTMEKVAKSEIIDFGEISTILETFVGLSTNKNIEEHIIVYNKLTEFLYKMIVREIYECDSNNILALLNKLDDKHDFLLKIKLLYLKEMKELGAIPTEITDGNSINMQNFIELLKAKGLEYKPKKKPTERIHVNREELIPDTGGRQINCLDFYREYHVNPLPKTDAENEALRKFNLLDLDYTAQYSAISKLLFRPYKNANLSYTNAIVIPIARDKKTLLSLKNANLEGVDMRGVPLKGVIIEGANLLNTGADITGAIGTPIGVSPYVESEKIFITSEKISPEEFHSITYHNPTPRNDIRMHYTNKANRILRLYDISCIDYSGIDYDYKGEDLPTALLMLNLSYTNADINPQDYKHYKSRILINLEGVDMRGKSFDGVEEIFGWANLKGTGANLDPHYNSTVSPYIGSTPKIKAH